MTYIVFDETSNDALIIDPVLNYDPGSSRISSESAEKVLSFCQQNDLKVHYILETHAHADHLSAAMALKEKLPLAKVAIGENIVKVQETFSKIYNLKNFEANGMQFDELLNEDKTLYAGTIKVRTLFTPGHTPACSSYLIANKLFTGDALFMPDFGTGRCDFPAGSAKELYHSVHEKLYQLPEDTIVYTGHDYQPGGRELRYQCTIKESKEKNVQLKASTTLEEFCEFRHSRDKTLKAPRLLLPSIQVNIRAGRLPKKEDNGVPYLKIPIRGDF